MNALEDFKKEWAVIKEYVKTPRHYIPRQYYTKISIYNDGDNITFKGQDEIVEEIHTVPNNPNELPETIATLKSGKYSTFELMTNPILYKLTRHITCVAFYNIIKDENYQLFKKLYKLT